MHGWPLVVGFVVVSAVMPAEDPFGRGCWHVPMDAEPPLLIVMSSPMAPVTGLVASQLYRCGLVTGRAALKSALNWSITFWMVSEPTPVMSVGTGALSFVILKVAVLPPVHLTLTVNGPTVLGGLPDVPQTPASLSPVVVAMSVTVLRLRRRAGERRELGARRAVQRDAGDDARGNRLGSCRGGHGASRAVRGSGLSLGTSRQAQYASHGGARGDSREQRASDTQFPVPPGNVCARRWRASRSATRSGRRGPQSLTAARVGK